MKTQLITVALVVAMTYTASAVTLVEFDLDGSGAVSTYASNDSQFSIINSAVTFDDAVNAISAINSWNYDGTGTAATKTNLINTSTFGSTSRFDLDLGLAATGFTYTITSAQVVIRANNEADATFQFGYRDTGGTAQIVGAELISTQSGAIPLSTYSIDLSGAGLTATDSTVAWDTGGTGELRFLFYDAAADDALNDNFQVAAIRLEGTVVPEPSAYALIGGFLALSWVMVRRRR